MNQNELSDFVSWIFDLHEHAFFNGEGDIPIIEESHLFHIQHFMGRTDIGGVQSWIETVEPDRVCKLLDNTRLAFAEIGQSEFAAAIAQITDHLKTGGAMPTCHDNFEKLFPLIHDLNLLRITNDEFANQFEVALFTYVQRHEAEIYKRHS